MGVFLSLRRPGWRELNALCPHLSHLLFICVVVYLQLLGITMRADIPLNFDLLSTVWKLLVGKPLDPSTDLQQADCLSYSYLKKMEMVS